MKEQLFKMGRHFDIFKSLCLNFNTVPIRAHYNPLNQISRSYFCLFVAAIVLTYRQRRSTDSGLNITFTISPEAFLRHRTTLLCLSEWRRRVRPYWISSVCFVFVTRFMTLVVEFNMNEALCNWAKRANNCFVLLLKYFTVQFQEWLRVFRLVIKAHTSKYQI